MVPEAPLEQTDPGLVPKGDGWFVVNAKEARWPRAREVRLGSSFRGRAGVQGARDQHRRPRARQPGCLYHRESAQENFLVLWGECLLLVEGEERPLKAWDFVHCPPWTDHVFVGAGDGPCAILAVGSRVNQDIVYPVSEIAGRHGASVETETPNPTEAYAPFGRSAEAPYRGQLDAGD